MSVEIVTKEDLQIFRLQLLKDIQDIITKIKGSADSKLEGYKTAQVRGILGCSVNKLVSLRVSKKIRVKKIGGTLYYNKEDIKRLLEEGY
jgi:hypothetical protein